MKKKIIDYTFNPEIGKLQKIHDSLPSTKELATAEEIINVSIPLSKKSVDFLKKSAKGTDIPYTGIIRNLVDAYVEHIQRP
ncbi:hypothetical protein KBD81_03015 [Candidatus Woesebacteria bacterium]|nr:hypothetical protein [Candidatus Woesebacteria bacterium]